MYLIYSNVTITGVYFGSCDISVMDLFLSKQLTTKSYLLFSQVEVEPPKIIRMHFICAA